MNSTYQRSVKVSDELPKLLFIFSTEKPSNALPPFVQNKSQRLVLSTKFFTKPLLWLTHTTNLSCICVILVFNQWIWCLEQNNVLLKHFFTIVQDFNTKLSTKAYRSYHLSNEWIYILTEKVVKDEPRTKQRDIACNEDTKFCLSMHVLVEWRKRTLKKSSETDKWLPNLLISTLLRISS